MKITCGVREFREAFDIVGRYVVSGKSTAHAIYSNAKLIVEGGKAVLLGHDPLEGIGVRCTVNGVSIERDGVVMLPRKTIGDILKAADDESFSLALTGNQLAISGKSSRYKIPTESPEAFAEPPKEIGTLAFIVSGPDLAQLVARTKGTVNPTVTNYAMGGIHVKWDADRVTVESTNSNTCVIATASVDSSGPKVTKEQMIIPADAAGTMAATFEGEPEVKVEFQGGHVVCQAGDKTASFRLLSGRFPDFKTILAMNATGGGKCEAVDPRLLLDAIEQASAVMGSDSMSRGCEFVFRKGELLLSAVDASLGSSEVEFPMDWIGDDVTAKFPTEKLAALLALKNMGSFSIAVPASRERMALHADGFDAYMMAMKTE